MKSNNNVSIQSNERNKDKIQIEIVADSVKIRESKDPNSQVIGNVYKNEIYSVISEDKESQYKWLEIETSNGIKGYIVGIEAYVKKLETTVIIEEEPIIDIPINDTNDNNENSNTPPKQEVIEATYTNNCNDGNIFRTTYMPTNESIEFCQNDSYKKKMKEIVCLENTIDYEHFYVL